MKETLDKFHLIHRSLAGEYLIAMFASAVFKDMENASIQEAARYLFEPFFAPLTTFVACAIPYKKLKHAPAYLLSAALMIPFKLINQELNQGVLFENILPNIVTGVALKFLLENSQEKVPMTPFVVNAGVAIGSTIIRTYKPLRQAGAELFVPALSAILGTLALDRILQRYFPQAAY